MVLFTDGWGDDPDLLSAAEDIAGAGITLSVVGTGEGPVSSSAGRRRWAGGGSMPGRTWRRCRRSSPRRRCGSPGRWWRRALPACPGGGIAGDLRAHRRPAAGGYILARPKPTSAVALEIGPGDPLLASWQRGLGRATAGPRMPPPAGPPTGSLGTFIDFWGEGGRRRPSGRPGDPPECDSTAEPSGSPTRPRRYSRRSRSPMCATPPGRSPRCPCSERPRPASRPRSRCPRTRLLGGGPGRGRTALSPPGAAASSPPIPTSSPSASPTPRSRADIAERPTAGSTPSLTTCTRRRPYGVTPGPTLAVADSPGAGALPHRRGVAFVVTTEWKWAAAP